MEVDNFPSPPPETSFSNDLLDLEGACLVYSREGKSLELFLQSPTNQTTKRTLLSPGNIDSRATTYQDEDVWRVPYSFQT